MELDESQMHICISLVYKHRNLPQNRMFHKSTQQTPHNDSIEWY